MSYILDALKKMEQEKNMKAAPKERINLSGALLKDNVRTPGKAKNSRLIGAVLIALIAASGATWFLLNKKTINAVTAAPKAVVQPQQAPAPPPPVPQPVPTPSVTTAQSAVAPAPPVSQVSPAPQTPGTPQKTSAVAAASSVKPPAATVQSSPVEDEEEARPRVRRQQKLAATAAPVARTVTAASDAPTIAAPANIKVTGIAWQDERSARRAVVNELLMKEGNIVSGAKIVEIKSDRVRFSLSGGTFDVLLLSSSISGTGK